MTTHEYSSAILLGSVFIMSACALVTLAWGRRFPRQGSWLAVFSVVILLGAAIFGWTALLEPQPQPMIRGWIWERSENGALLVGIMQDAISLVMSGLAALVTGTFLLNLGTLSKEPRPERLYAAAIFSTAGVTLAWVSGTPWLAFLGLGIAIFGGFMSLGSRWDSESDAALAARFAWERSAGLILAVFGAGILASSRAPLTLAADQLWGGSAAPWAGNGVGAGLLVAGLFIQMQSFPTIGWVVSPSAIYQPARILFAQVFPAWASFAILIRLEPQLRSLGVFPVFGWVALASAVLTICSGLVQDQWRAGLGAWLSSSLAVAFAVLAFSGPWAAAAMLIGISLGAAAMTYGATLLEDASVESKQRKVTWSKVAIVLGVVASTGVFGFVTCAGSLRWIAQAWAEPAQAAVFAVAVFLLALSGWKLAWDLLKKKSTVSDSWFAVVAPFFLLMLSLGVVWTGTASGGVLPANEDRLVASALDLLFGRQAGAFTDETAFASASWLYWGALVVGVMTAFWTAGRKRNLWRHLIRALPRFSAFLAKGYLIDVVFKKVYSGLKTVSSSTEWLIEKKIWKQWLSVSFMKGIRGAGQGVVAFDNQMTSRLGTTLRHGVEIPAKILQLIQSGDMQWYLFFAVGSGVAILLHFVR